MKYNYLFCVKPRGIQYIEHRSATASPSLRHPVSAPALPQYCFIFLSASARHSSISIMNEYCTMYMRSRTHYTSIYTPQTQVAKPVSQSKSSDRLQSISVSVCVCVRHTKWCHAIRRRFKSNVNEVAVAVAVAIVRERRSLNQLSRAHISNFQMRAQTHSSLFKSTTDERRRPIFRRNSAMCFVVLYLILHRKNNSTKGETE